MRHPSATDRYWDETQIRLGPEIRHTEGIQNIQHSMLPKLSYCNMLGPPEAVMGSRIPLGSGWDWYLLIPRSRTAM